MDKKTLALILIALLFVLIYISESSLFFSDVTYINATDITPVGFASSAGNNVSLISVHDDIPWNGTEAAGTPWTVYVTFTNVSTFNYVESLMKYNSTGVQPSQHEVNLSIWCVTMQEWEELEDNSLDLEYHYRATKIINTSHYISPVLNGTVVLKLTHADAGNANHRLWIDLLRLVNEPQFEQINVTTGTGGTSAPCTNCVNYTQLSDNMSLKVNKSGDTMTGILNMSFNNIINASGLNISAAGPIIFLNSSNASNKTGSFIITDNVALQQTAALFSTNRWYDGTNFQFGRYNAPGYTLSFSASTDINSAGRGFRVRYFPTGSTTAQTNFQSNEQTTTVAMGNLSVTSGNASINGNMSLNPTNKPSGITMYSPDGNDWCITITNAGTLTTSSTPCKLT